MPRPAKTRTPRPTSLKKAVDAQVQASEDLIKRLATLRENEDEPSFSKVAWVVGTQLEECVRVVQRWEEAFAQAVTLAALLELRRGTRTESRLPTPAGPRAPTPATPKPGAVPDTRPG